MAALRMRLPLVPMTAFAAEVEPPVISDLKIYCFLSMVFFWLTKFRWTAANRRGLGSTKTIRKMAYAEHTLQPKRWHRGKIIILISPV
jgi:hypothetical protein